ncbi:filamentation induced by cAMP protein Fic, partial [mine drainage metagenome]
YLQPFTDVNKRTSRLTANVPLLKSGLCPLSFVGVEPLAYTSALLGVYELNDVSLARDLFIYACERSVQAYLAVDQTLAQPDPVRMARRTLIFNGVAAIVRDNPANQKAYAEEYVQKTGGIRRGRDGIRSGGQAHPGGCAAAARGEHIPVWHKARRVREMEGCQ